MKILVLDIETSPHLSFHWGRWQQNISPDFTVEESRTLCWAAKWFGERKVYFMSSWKDGHDSMVLGIYEMLDEADMVIGYNSNSFDLKRLNAEFIRLGLTPPSPYHKVDLLRQVRKHFSFSSNKLKHVLEELDLTPKLEENVNMQLWIDVVLHHKKTARERMRRYNIQDVKSTEELYEYLLGWIDGHLNWGLFVDDVTNVDNPTCPNCGGQHMHRHKVRSTRVKTYQQWHCQDCGKYARGRRALTKLKESEGVLT